VNGKDFKTNWNPLFIPGDTLDNDALALYVQALLNNLNDHNSENFPGM
jgi:hypothetical protein